MAFPSDAVIKCQRIARCLCLGIKHIIRTTIQAFKIPASPPEQGILICDWIMSTMRNLFTIAFGISMSFGIFFGFIIYFHYTFLFEILIPSFYKRMSNQPMAFAIINLSTDSLWYGRVWDGSGSIVPSWKSVFG